MLWIAPGRPERSLSSGAAELILGAKASARAIIRPSFRPRPLTLVRRFGMPVMKRAGGLPRDQTRSSQTARRERCFTPGSRVLAPSLGCCRIGASSSVLRPPFDWRPGTHHVSANWLSVQMAFRPTQENREGAGCRTRPFPASWRPSGSARIVATPTLLGAGDQDRWLGEACERERIHKADGSASDFGCPVRVRAREAGQEFLTASSGCALLRND
jgi:hypothetical protein